MCRLSRGFSDSINSTIPINTGKRKSLKRLVRRSRAILTATLLPLAIYSVKTEADQIIQIPPAIVQQVRERVENLTEVGLESIHLLGLHEAYPDKPIPRTLKRLLGIFGFFPFSLEFLISHKAAARIQRPADSLPRQYSFGRSGYLCASAFSVVTRPRLPSECPPSRLGCQG